MSAGNSFQISLPFPVSANNLFAGKRRRYISPSYRRWRRQADLEFIAAKAPKISGPVEVEITFIPRDKRRRDADNFVKPILDAAVRMSVIKDDSAAVVRKVSASWASPAKHALAIVTIRCV